MVIRIGDRTESAQRLVEVESKHERDLVPIPHPLTVEGTAKDWDPTALPGNAIIRNAKVRCTFCDIFSCERSCFA